ncbi:hypothetical protein QAD02_008205 [Eretmocerus hayati]|uniref:Uncharacterized protein n=1 Tax=Eretmocerus hayati TaxID=131215 RepID=A0ACC2N752_9HYME|nr:hypothetical protein QAD02_008205 [Eretmocerus hayati]
MEKIVHRLDSKHDEYALNTKKGKYKYEQHQERNGGFQTHMLNLEGVAVTADVGPDPERPVARIPPGISAQQGPAHPVPEAIPLRRIIDEMRGLEARDHPNDEDEGYASGDDDVRRREPLEHRIRDLEPLLLNQSPLIPFDFEMHEFLEPPRNRVHPEEPVLVEDDQIENDRPPFLIEINLGQIRYPLPRRDQTPLHWSRPYTTASSGWSHSKEECVWGMCMAQWPSPPTGTSGRFHMCITERRGDLNHYLEWQIFDEHVLGSTRVFTTYLLRLRSSCIFFFEDIDRCRICLGMLDAHWPEILRGVRLRATLVQAAIFWNH